MDVALHQAEGPVALSDISRRQGLSHKYLWQVINPLKAAGLLHAIRGSRGGYTLARAPQEISIRDIVNILEGPVSTTTRDRPPEASERNVFLTAHAAWTEIETKLNDAMRAITLKDLIQRHKELESRRGPTYDI